MSQKGFSGAMFIFCLMLPILTLLIIGCSVNNDEDESQPNTGVIGRTYTNREYGFQISLPTELIGWSIIEDKSIKGLLVTMKDLSDSPPQTIANIGVETLSVSLTSEEYLEAIVVSWSAEKDWKEESRRAIKISGKDGYEIIYTYKTIKMIQQFVIKGKYVYVFTGGDFAEKFEEDIFLKIMETFRFLP